MSWFDEISPSQNYNPKPSAGSNFLRNYRFGNLPKRKSNLRITPSCTLNKSSRSDEPNVILKGNCAPPTPIIRNNMMRAYVVRGNEMCQFFRLIDEDSIIKKFLEMDSCCIYADKYFLAIVFAHFKRSNLSLSEYTRTNFFLCLYLAHDIEADNEDLKYEIFPWVLGPYWRKNVKHFLLKKDELWARMNYRAIVSKKCCEELISIYPSHPAWERERSDHHGGATRSYKRDMKLSIPRGPNYSPKTCNKCHPEKYSNSVSESQHDSAFSSFWEDCDSSDDNSSSTNNEETGLLNVSLLSPNFSEIDDSRKSSVFDIEKSED